MVPRSQFSCLYGLPIQRYHSSQPSMFVCDHNWIVISDFFLLLQRKIYYFRTLDLHAKQAWGQLRKTLFSFINFLFLFPLMKSILFLRMTAQFIKVHEWIIFLLNFYSHIFTGSSSWIDFTNPEICKWWASKFALSEYQVIWKFTCFFNGTITSPLWGEKKYTINARLGSTKHSDL